MQRTGIFFTLLLLVSGNLAQAGENVFTPNGFSKNIAPNFSGIFSGDPVKPADWAWSSTLYLKLDGGSCTGTLISPRFVLTAAHCGIHTPQGVGFYDGEKIIDTRRVVKTTVHPQYTPEAETWDKYNDVALLQLDSPAPARFVPTPLLTGFNQIQPTALIVGYGLVGPKGMRNGLTSATLKVVGIDEKGFLIKFSDPSSKQSACPGDSGGPAYMKIGSQNYLAAVTSFIDAKDGDCGDPLHSTFSVLVINYIDWIKSVMSAAQ